MCCLDFIVILCFSVYMGFLIDFWTCKNRVISMDLIQTFEAIWNYWTINTQDLLSIRNGGSIWISEPRDLSGAGWRSCRKAWKIQGDMFVYWIEVWFSWYTICQRVCWLDNWKYLISTAHKPGTTPFCTRGFLPSYWPEIISRLFVGWPMSSRNGFAW